MVGSNFDGPKPDQTGMFGAIVWVRSMYLAPLRCWSYTAQRPVSSAAPAADAQPMPRMSTKPARTTPSMGRPAVRQSLIGFMVPAPLGKPERQTKFPTWTEPKPLVRNNPLKHPLVWGFWCQARFCAPVPFSSLSLVLFRYDTK